MDKRGWSLRSYQDKIPAFFKQMFDSLSSEWLTNPPEEMINDNNNTTSGFWPDDVKICMDTVPISVDARPHCYNPKYAEHVIKAMVGCTMTGYICFLGRQLYTGASSDSVIQDCGILHFLQNWNVLMVGFSNAEA